MRCLLKEVMVLRSNGVHDTLLSTCPSPSPSCCMFLVRGNGCIRTTDRGSETDAVLSFTAAGGFFCPQIYK